MAVGQNVSAAGRPPNTSQTDWLSVFDIIFYSVHHPSSATWKEVTVLKYNPFSGHKQP